MADFILAGTTLADPLGLWHSAAPAGTAFSQVVAGPAEPLWTIRLEAEPEMATRALAEQQAILQQRCADLEAARRALTQVGSPLSFAGGAEVAPPLVGPTRDLEATLTRIRQPVAFGGVGEPAPPAEREAASEWSAFVEEARRILAHYAHIQTEWNGTPIGLTTVNWTGDFRTTWTEPTGAAAQHLHLQAVETALASRAAWLQLIATVAGGAVGLAVKASVPGGQLLLLPAVWRFVRDVLAAWAAIPRGA